MTVTGYNSICNKIVIFIFHFNVIHIFIAYKSYRNNICHLRIGAIISNKQSFSHKKLCIYLPFCCREFMVSCCSYLLPINKRNFIYRSVAGIPNVFYFGKIQRTILFHTFCHKRVAFLIVKNMKQSFNCYFP